MSRLSKWYHHYIRFEWILFYALVLLNAIPAIRQPFFPSVDGPAHLYNAKLVLGLVSGDSEFLSQYYAFTTWVVPNWGGHFILAALLSVFSGQTASQIFIGLCVILLPVSFRYCVKKINSEAVFTTYLIFPFTYTFMLCMGFYNFYIGTCVLFFAVGTLIHYRRSPFRPGLFVVLFLLILLCYLSHLFVFISLGMAAVCLYLPDIIGVIFSKERRKEVLKKSAFLFLAFVFPIIFALGFFAHTSGGHNNIYSTKSDLLLWLIDCRSLIWYILPDESMYTSFVFLVFFFLFAIAIYIRSKQFHKDLGEQPSLRSFFQAFRFQDIFLLMLVTFIFLYFKLADSDSVAGFVSVRLNLMVFLFLILWTSGFNYPGWISVASFLILLFSQYSLLKLHNKSFEGLGSQISEIKVVERYIKERTVILPLDYARSWLSPHNSNYLGINKSVLILENHECNNSYFPLKWKHTKLMQAYTSSDDSRLEYFIRKPSPEIVKQVDYIFVQNKTFLPDTILAEILKGYRLKKETNSLLLFENKMR